MVQLDAEELARRSTMVIEEWNGIVAHFEAFYLQSILYSSGRACEAFVRFDVARALKDTDATQVSAIHEALGHCAALSRYFWPSGLGTNRGNMKGLRTARAEKLRGAFGLTSDSPLRDRRLRDSLEHFDERLDEYLLQYDEGYFFPSAIVGDADLATDKWGHIFKLVDPQRLVFVCIGEAYEFGPLRSSVEAIFQAASGMDADGSRLPSNTD